MANESLATGFSSDYRFESVNEFSTDTNYVAEWETAGENSYRGLYVTPDDTARSLFPVRYTA